MSRKLPSSGRAGTVLLLLLLPLVQGQVLEGEPPEPAHWIVGFHEVPPGLVVGGTWNGGTVYRVAPETRMAALRTADPGFKLRAYGDPNVHYVEPEGSGGAAALVPDDPRFALQYAPQQVRAPGAWAVTTAGGASRLCVLDTGYRGTHEDLSGPRAAPGWDFVDDDADASDADGHGTHVQGIASAGVGNGVGIAGAGNLQFHHVRVLESNQSAQASAIAAGVEWCHTHAGPKAVISMSLFAEPRGAVHSAIQAAAAKGHLLVAASGNRYPDGCAHCVRDPAAHPDVVAVGCTTSTHATCPYQRSGPEMEIVAPGDGVLSTCRASDVDYCALSGTSMSTPLVAGFAALYWGAHPDLTARQVRERLQNATVDRGLPGRDPFYGFGELDADCLMRDVIPCSPLRGDAFADAYEIAALPFAHQHVWARTSLEAGEPASCGALGGSVWYRWTARAHGTATLTTEGSTVDSVLGVYRGPGLSDLVEVGCHDDGSTPQAALTFTAQAGATYWIQVGAKPGASGDVRVRLTCAPGDCRPPVNDHMASARVLLGPDRVTGSTNGATVEAGEDLGCADVGATVWWKWRATISGQASVDTFGSGFNTVLAVHQEINGERQRIQCSDDAGDTFQSMATFTAALGTTYWFQVGGFQGAWGDYQLKLLCSACQPRPSHDEPASPVVVDRPTFTHATEVKAATISGTAEPRVLPRCSQVSNTVWYRLRPDRDGEVTADTMQSDFDTVLALYVEPANATLAPAPLLVPQDCNPSADGTERSRLRFNATAGLAYYFQAGVESGNPGTLVLKVNCTCVDEHQGNDDRHRATPIPVTPATASQDTRLATRQAGEPQPCGSIGSTVWYKHAPLVPGVLKASTKGSGFDTVLAVYVDLGGVLLLLGCSDDVIGLGTASEVTFVGLPGLEYHLQAGGYNGLAGDLKLRLG